MEFLESNLLSFILFLPVIVAAAIALIFLINYLGIRPYNQTSGKLAEARCQIKELEQRNTNLQ